MPRSCGAPFIAAFAALIGMRFAAQRSAQLTVGLLAAFGLLIGLAVAPAIAYYGSMDPRALREAGRAIALFIAGSSCRSSPAGSGDGQHRPRSVAAALAWLVP